MVDSDKICTALKEKTLGGLAAPQTPSLLEIKSKNKALGSAQTRQGNNSPAP
ncbi:MAG: hypothetical protein HQL68_06985, partial [Magnetococcales bacterium]|nr:hypothetical protein [Magnetococcales bacterium]